MSKLEILSGKRQGAVVDLPTAGELEIGNRKSAGISIRDPWISYNHAKIVGQSGSFFIEDLGSSNGTWINGARVKRQQLGPNDLIYFGKTKVRFVSEGPAPEEPAPAPTAAGGEVPWWDRALQPGDGAASSGPDTARMRRLEDELHEERRMRRALERFLELPDGAAAAGDASRAGELEREVSDLRAKLAALDGQGGGADPAAVQAAVAEETEKLRREHMSKVVELEGRAAQAEARAVDFEARLKDKSEQVKKEVSRAKEKVQAELDEVKAALDEARKSASEMASGGDAALASERERGDRLERELEQWRSQAREHEERVEALERELGEAQAAAAKGGGEEAVETLKSQLWAAVEEATKWKEEAAKAEEHRAEAERWQEEHAKVLQEIDEISMEQIEIEDELNGKISALKERLGKYEEVEDDEPAEDDEEPAEA